MKVNSKKAEYVQPKVQVINVNTESFVCGSGDTDPEESDF